MADGHYFETKGGEGIKNVLDQLASAKLKLFRETVIGDIEVSPEGPITKEDTTAYEALVGKEEYKCFDEETLPFVKGIEYYDAYYRLQSTPHFNVLKNKLQKIFTVLKDILISEFTEAPWTTKHPDLLNFIKTVKLNHLKALDFQFEKETDIMKQRYEECFGLTSNATTFAKKCLNYAVCAIMKKTLRKIREDDEVGLTLFTGGAFDRNAQYNAKKNHFTPMPFFYALEEDELPYMLGSIDVIFSHEMGHVFFRGNHSVPSNFECFRQHMLKSCIDNVDFKADCYWYHINSYNGVYARFGDDASDWIGMRAGLKALRYYFPQTLPENPLSKSPESMEIMRKFFYARGIDWCTSDPDTADFAHSPSKVRVNGICSLFPEFAEVFGCKRGNRMAKAATCLPFAGPGAPTHKRNGMTL